MKIVTNMVRKPFKKGDVIFETNEKSDELYLIPSDCCHFCSVGFSRTFFSFGCFH